MIESKLVKSQLSPELEVNNSIVQYDLTRLD